MDAHVINRCTHGRDLSCGNHGPESVTLSYRKPGVLMAHATVNTSTGPRGVWMRNSGWRKVRPHAGRMVKALQAFAARKITYDLPTVCIRKKT